MANDNGFIELKKDIRDNKIRNLYLFFGDEVYVKELYLNKMKEAIDDGGFPDFNHIFLDDKDLDFSLINDSIESFPMMSEKKLVIIKNSGIFSKPKEEVKTFWSERLGALPEYVTLIFDEEATDKRNSLYKQVVKTGLSVEFEFLKEADMIAWLEREARKHKKIISKNNSAYMISICDDGLSYVKNELDKLLNFCDEEITISDIDRLVSKSLSVRVFELADAIMAENSHKALSLINDFKTVKESAFKILYLLSGTFDKLLRTKLMLKEGASLTDISEKTGLKPFVVKKYIESGKKFTEKFLVERIMRVADIDLSIKEGSIEEWVALEQYVLEAVKKA